MLALLLLSGLGTAAGATAFSIGKPLCYAVERAGTPPVFACAGEPAGYQLGRLLLRADLTQVKALGDAPILLIHQTRFDRLTVLFGYADGHVERQTVRRGDYGAHWRIGGQMAFAAPPRDAPLTRVTLAFDHLATHNLLRIRMMSAGAGNRDLAIVATLAGGAISLLLAGALYNLSLSVTGRRRFLAWHSLWAVIMVFWGLFWSQAALILLPGVAGTTGSQICTLLACLAVWAATMSTTNALQEVVPAWVLRGVTLIAVAVVLLGIPATLATGNALGWLGSALGLLVLADLFAVTACMAWSWRLGSGEARDLAKSWGLPMSMLALALVVNLDDRLFGGGSQIAVLLGSALQTIWLAITVTRRLSIMRVELEAAREAEVALVELAHRDPMTGLLNRRGFVERLRIAFQGGNEDTLGLLLFDVDHFKTINDQFGHEVGDAVLCRIATYLLRLERELCISGRMGGEEFVLAISGLTAFAIEQFADRIRADIAALDHGDILQHRPVTVSIGVAEGSTRTAFQRLYSAADRALYDAKRQGRNRVVFHADDGRSRETLERDQLTFRWQG